MKNFLTEYGTSIVVIICIVLLIAMASPIGNTIFSSSLNTINQFTAVVNGDGVNDEGIIGNVDDAMDKVINISGTINRTEDGDVTSDNNTEGKDTGDIGDLDLN